eukprot:6185693-Pleurochrysis_carterae.AAC.2
MLHPHASEPCHSRRPYCHCFGARGAPPATCVFSLMPRVHALVAMASSNVLGAKMQARRRESEPSMQSWNGTS